MNSATYIFSCFSVDFNDDRVQSKVLTLTITNQAQYLRSTLKP